MTVKTLLAAGAALMAALGWGKTIEDTGFTYADSGDVVPGEWNSQYAKALEYAAENDCPVVAFWAKSGCGYCKSLERAIVANKKFASWAKERGYVLLFGYNTDGENKKTKTFASDASGKFPYVGLGWNGRKIGEASGNVHSKGTIGKDYRLTFSGRRTYMPGASSEDLAEIFMSSCDKYLGAYTPVNNSFFTAGDTACDRLECEAGTTNVAVELVRDNARSVLNEKLVIVGPNGAAVTNGISWAAEEAVKTVGVDVTKFSFSKDGDRLTLSIVTAKGVAASTTHVTYVEKENSAANPDWIGEPLAFGRWTADLDGAKEFAKNNGGYTLVSVQGSLWCPDCANTDRNFLDLEEGGVNRIKAWAASKKVTLVSMDIPNYTGPSVTNCATPTLFSKAAYATTLARAKEYPESGAEAYLTNAIVRSGLGYLSRKGISDAEAAATKAKFHELALTNTEKGGFHRPEDGNKNRTGVPIFVLLRGDGSVAARFTRFAAVSPKAANRADFDSYVKRFEEMLALADGDATEIANNFAEADNALAVAANGGEIVSTLCNADFQDAVRLTGLTGTARQTLTIKGPRAVAVSVQMYVLGEDGKATAVGVERICSDLTQGMSFSEETVERGAYFALVKGRDITSEAFRAESTNALNFVEYALSGSTVYVPAEARAEGVADSGKKARIVLKANVLYRITNVDAEACAAVLRPEVTGSACEYFTALVGGEQELTFKQESEGFEFQIWKPGTIGFADPASRSVPASINDKNDDFVEIAVERKGGSSGSVTVDVAVDRSTDYGYIDGDKVVDSFVFAGPTSLVWEDGVTSNMIVRVKILDNTDKPTMKDEGDVVLTLGTAVGEAGYVERGNTNFTLHVYKEVGDPTGRIMVTGSSPSFAKGTTVYVREGEAARICVARIEDDFGLIGAEVNSSLEGVDFSTENPRDLETVDDKLVLWWSSGEMGEKYLCVSNVPAGKSATISLAPHGKSQIVREYSSVTVRGLDATAPYFVQDDLSATLYRYVAVSNFFAVAGTQGGKLTLKKLSGSLPAGLKLSVAEGGVALVGAPTATKTCDAVYQIVEQRGKTKVEGLTLHLQFWVVDPAVAGGGEKGDEPLNSFFVKSRTYNDIMVIEPETASLIGTLKLTLPAKGNASGKFKSIYGSLSYSAKSWSDLSTNGDYTVVLACKSADYKSSTIEVTAHASGELDLTVGGISGETWSLTSGKFWSSEESAKDYQGLYTVAMPLAKVVTDPLQYAPLGTPYLTLKMTTASQFKNGKMTWAGMLANGKSISGSAVLTENVRRGKGDWAYLPVFAQTKTDTFGAIAAITNGANARVEAGEGDCYRSVISPSFELDTRILDVKPYWRHEEIKDKKANYAVQYDLYGSIYSLADGLDCCCEEAVGAKTLTMDVLCRTNSPTYGALGPVQSVKLDATETKIVLQPGQDNPQKLKFSLNASGVVSGSFKLPYGDGSKTLTAKYKGVVLIGWGSACGCGDLDLPFIQGSWYFTDKVEGLSVGRGDVIRTRTTSEN